MRAVERTRRMTGRPGQLRAALHDSAAAGVRVEADARAGVDRPWWTPHSEAAVMAGHAHRGTGGAPSSSGRCYAVTPKVEFRGFRASG
jgi:hypothetical protein